MLGSNVFGETTFRTWKCAASRWGTLCGVFAMLFVCLGLSCPPRPVACSDANPCDDGDSCSTDTCGDDGFCDFVDIVCDDGQECDDGVCKTPCNSSDDCDDDDACTVDDCGNDGFCTISGITDCDDENDCTVDSCDAATGCENTPDDTVCDDGLFCNGEETCDAVDGCVDGTEPCDVDEVCVEANDSCTTTCDTAADCADDGDACTVETCTENVCLSTAVDCDDGDECTTDDCDPDTGCTNDAVVCDAGELCDPDTGACVPGEECDINADCPDDGLFCTGVESCNTTTGFCQATGNPCVAPQTCNEALNACESAPGVTILFTLGIDSLVGTAGNDTFSAPLAFNAPTGTNLPTLQNSDSANGGDGSDVLNAQFDSGAASVTLAPSLTSIESLNITDFGSPGGTTTTLSAVNATGVTTVSSVNSTDDAVTVTNVNTLVSLGVTNTASDLLVTLIAPGTNGNADASAVTLSGARTGATVTLTTPVNGVETFNVSSGGAAANVLDALTQATGTTLTTFNVSGAQNLTITAALNTTLTTVNASAATGNTDLNLTGNALTVAYTGGSGNDTVNFAAGYTAADTINGGAGTDNLGLNSAQAVAATTQQTNVSNVEAVRIADSLNGNIDVTKFGATTATAATDATLDTAAAATALTAGVSQITLGTGNRTLTLNNDDTANALTVVVSGAGTADVLTVNAQNADLGAAFTATGAETVSLVSANGSDGTAADGNANTATAFTITPTFGASTLNISGSVPVTFTGIVTAVTINAGTLTAALTMGAQTAVGTTITGSAFNDTLFGSASSDGINGGDGNDKMIGRAAGDSLVGGTGVDTHQYQQLTDGGAADADNVGMDLINGFVLAAGGDIIAFQDDIFFNNNDVLDLDIITGAAAGNVVTGFTDGGATAAQVVVQTTPLTNFAAVAALFTALDAVATTTELVVIAEVTGVGTFVFHDPNSAVANGEVVLGQLVGITGANLTTIVAANLAVNDG